ncbi:MAG TPA: VCBS repeat-containing protein, partial [Terriglobales bacterium]|nr:VCBS repeat-containing protein [Terriglobales bacterium]
MNLLFVLSWLLTTALPQASAAGCFLKPIFYNAGGVAVAVGDVNNDGNLDLIITGGSSAKTIIIFLGNADGSFGTRNQYPLPQPGHKAVLGDFNRDGNLDIAVPVQDFRFHVPGMSVLLGNGDGTFQSAVLY